MKPLREYLDFRGQTVLITGAANGIGRAVADRFGELGANLWLIDKDKDGLEEITRRLRAQSVQVTPYELDLQEKSAIDRLWVDIGKQRIHVLINNAGMYPFKDFLLLDEAYLTRVMQVNCYAVLWMCQQMIQRNKKKGGVIINVGSIEAIMPFKKELVQY